jgi:Lrp/AsnC family leucine-responsive transcriptional regulator
MVREGIDATDARILELLQLDGRKPYAVLGAEVGISGPAAHERVKRLEARGMISHYAAVLDPEAVGFGILAFTWITQTPGTLATDLTGDFEAIHEIEDCHHVAGEADYLLKIRARDTRDLESIVHRIQSIGHVSTTETQIVFSSAFERRALRFQRETDRTRES